MVVSGMRWLDDRLGGHDAGSAAALAVGGLPAARRRPGSSRSLGLDARTVAATVGGQNWAEDAGEAVAAGNGGAAAAAAASVRGLAESRSVALQLAGGVRVEFGQVARRFESPSSRTNGSDGNGSDGSDGNGRDRLRDVSAGHDPLSHSFIEISLARAGGSGEVAVCARREFTKLGEVMFDHVYEAA